MRTALLLLLAAAPLAPARDVPRVAFTQYRTAQGLRVLLAPDRSSPAVAVAITYDAGSRNERPGRTGVANLLHEKLLRDLRRQCADRLLIPATELAAACRGSINQERVSYSLSVPADRWERALSLLAGQMRTLDLNPAGMDRLRAEILEQRRSDAGPFTKAGETLLGLSFQSFAYKHQAEGSEADLRALDLADVQRFFQTRFAPDHAALALVGPFDAMEARHAIGRHFGSLPRRGPSPPVSAAEAVPATERRVVLREARATHPQILIAYKTVPSDHPDWYTLNLLADILGQGEISRLRRALVATGLASDLGEGMSESRAPSLFRIQVNLSPGGAVEKVETALDEEIARVQRDGVTQAELALARSQESDYWRQLLTTPQGRAETLARFAIYYRDPERVNGELKTLLSRTAADVRRVARKYLSRDRRAVVITLPAGAAAVTSGRGSPGSCSPATGPPAARRRPPSSHR